MIRVEKLTVKYNDNIALKEVSLEIPKGTSCAIIGLSGCGKTTLLYSIAKVIEKDSGEIYINKEKINESNIKKSLILQQLGLFPWKTVEKNILMGMKRNNLNKHEKNVEIDKVLKELGIADIKNKYIKELSGGQKQRVAIARSIVNNPEIFMLDEATSALDSINKEKIQDLLLDIHIKRKNTMICVTHSIEEAVFLGEKIVVMEDGNIKSTIQNKYFKDKEIRKKEEYLRICNEVRSKLYD